MPGRTRQDLDQQLKGPPSSSLARGRHTPRGPRMGHERSSSRRSNLYRPGTQRPTALIAASSEGRVIEPARECRRGGKIVLGSNARALIDATSYRHPDRPVRVGARARAGERADRKDHAERARRRGYLVFATDPTVSPEDPGYCETTPPRQGLPTKQRASPPLAAGRRLHAYLATGKYKHELADAHWVA